MRTRTLLSIPRTIAFARQYSVKVAAEEPILTVKNIPAPHTGQISILKINRPQAKNALSRALVQGLNQLFTKPNFTHAQSVPNGVRALIIASSTKGIFCAGADLKERATFTRQETDEFLATLRETFQKLEDLEIPTISAIDGVALGGGLELALCTTFRVCSPGTVLGLPETRIGIIPGAGGTVRLKRIVGEARALDMILTGRRVPAEEAEKWGLCQVAEGDAVEGAIKLAEQICGGAPIAINAALKAVKACTHEAEDECYKMVVDSSDRNEGLAAFREKRPVRFRGA